MLACVFFTAGMPVFVFMQHSDALDAPVEVAKAPDGNERARPVGFDYTH